MTGLAMLGISKVARLPRIGIAVVVGASGSVIYLLLRRRSKREPRAHDEETPDGSPCERQEPLVPQGASALQAAADVIFEKLVRYKPVEVEGVDPSLHYLPPHVLKVAWTELGNLVVEREKSACGAIDGSRWISLRLDGSGFSKAVKSLRRNGVLEADGFSETFADCMVSALRVLMEHVNASIGYTQSDEMVVFIPPTRVIRGERQPHLRNGRVTKLTTLAAGLVTAHFVLSLAQTSAERGAGLSGLAAVLPHFDCRLSSFATWEEARALLLWRAYDCSVNGVSDAVHQIKGSGKAAMALGTSQKVAWLCERGHLPLPRHQAYGTILARGKRVHTGYNPKADMRVETVRSTLEMVDGPVLELARTGRLVQESLGAFVG